MARPVPGWGLLAPLSSVSSWPGRPRLVHAALDREAASPPRSWGSTGKSTPARRGGGPWGLGGLRRVRPGTRCPRRRRRGTGPRPVHAVPRAPRPQGRRIVPPPLAREVPPSPTLLSPRATNCAQDTRGTAATTLLRRGSGRTPVATRAATAANAPKSETRTKANPPANAPPHTPKPRPHQPQNRPQHEPAPAPLRHCPHHLGPRHAGRTRTHVGPSGAPAR